MPALACVVGHWYVQCMHVLMCVHACGGCATTTYIYVGVRMATYMGMHVPMCVLTCKDLRSLKKQTATGEVRTNIDTGSVTLHVCPRMDPPHTRAPAPCVLRPGISRLALSSKKKKKLASYTVTWTCLVRHAPGPPYLVQCTPCSASRLARSHQTYLARRAPRASRLMPRTPPVPHAIRASRPSSCLAPCVARALHCALPRRIN
jgi:hypothetical protein